MREECATSKLESTGRKTSYRPLVGSDRGRVRPPDQLRLNRTKERFAPLERLGIYPGNSGNSGKLRTKLGDRRDVAASFFDSPYGTKADCTAKNPRDNGPYVVPSG
jgi:hypothetical protein